MKELMKRFSALFLAVLLIVTGFSSSVHAAASTDVKKVTISNVEEGATVKLFRVAQATYDGENFTGYKFMDNLNLIDPLTQITVNDGTDNVKMKSEEVGKAQGNVVIQSTSFTIGTKTYTPVDNVGKVIYDLRKPTQEAILAANLSGGTPYDTVTAVAGDYAQVDVNAGQYIVYIEPPTGTTHQYQPMVISAGYRGLPIMVPATGTDATHYALVDGSYTDVDPTDATKHLYEAAAGADPVKAWKEDGTTNVLTSLVAQNLDLGPINSNNNDNTPFDWKFLDATDIVAKRIGEPKIEKDVLNPTEEIELKMVAVDENGLPILDASGKPYYINKNYTIDDYLMVLGSAAGTQFNETAGTPYKVEAAAGGTYTKDEMLTRMRTTVEADALVVKRDALAATVGEVINYQITPTLPSYNSDAKNKTLTFTDNMSDSIDFLKDSINVTVGSATINRIYDDTLGAEKYVFYIKSSKTFDSSVVGEFVADPTEAGSGYYYIDSGDYVQITTTVFPADGTELYQLLAVGFVYDKAALIAAGETPRDFQLNFVYDNLPGPQTNKIAPIITYSGTLNDKAVDQGIAGNKNTATMYYAPDPDTGSTHDPNNDDIPSNTETKEATSEVYVYTFQIKARKTNDKDEYLSTMPDGYTGAVYKMLTIASTATPEQKAAVTAYLNENADVKKMYLKNDAVGAYFVTSANAATVVAGSPAAVLSASTEDYYDNPEFKTLAGAQFGIYENADDAHAGNDNYYAVATSDAQGIVTFSGLTTAEWYLRELKAPGGYVLYTDAIPVTATWSTITVQKTETKTTNVYTADNSTTGITDEDLANGGNRTVQKGWLVAAAADSTDGTFYPLDHFDATTLLDNGSVTVGTNNIARYKTADGSILYIFKAYLKRSVTSTITLPGTTTPNPTAGFVVDVPRVNNTNISELPSTGGIGTYLFTIAGVAILSLAAFMLVFRKKEARQ